MTPLIVRLKRAWKWPYYVYKLHYKHHMPWLLAWHFTHLFIWDYIDEWGQLTERGRVAAR